MRKKLVDLFWIYLLFLPLFYTLDLPTWIYLLMVGGIWIMLLLKYPISSNRKWYCQLVPAFLCNLFTFALAKWLRGYYLVFDLEDIGCVFYGLAMLALIFKIHKAMGKDEINEPQDDLFCERKYDRERLLEYLKEFSIVGVNGAWGSGKSFLVDHIEDDTYMIVKIDLLACNVDDIQAVLLNELDKVLKDAGIFSPFSPKLKKLLQQERVLQNLSQIFVRDDISYSDAITGFRDSLSQVKQTLIIVYEDLDRIEKPEVIQRIMGISEKMVGKKIKVLYQFDEQNLQKKGFDRIYLEKYIPFTLNLTEIPFARILDYLFAKENQKNLSVDRADFNFLCLPINTPFAFCGKSRGATISLKLPNVTIRRTEHFLKEINTFLKKDSVYEKNKREVILFFLLKHFYYELYQMLVPGQSLIESFQFHYEGVTNTIINWIRNCRADKEDISDIFLAEENRVSALMISLFQYECDISEIPEELEEIVNEPIRNIRNKNTNEQKDRIIWNLLCSGKSEYTDQMVVTKRMYEEVLNTPREKQIQNFQKLCNDVYHGQYGEKLKGDNHTIFRLGVPGMISLFQANRVAGRTGAQWIQLVDFYLYYKECTWIHPELIECFNYCDLSDRKFYLYLLNRFNNLEIKQNLNSHKAYFIFLDHFLSAFSSLGFVDTEEVWIIRNSDSKQINIERIENFVFKGLEEKLKKLRNKIQLENVRDDIDILMNFLDKNQKLIHAEAEFSRPELHVKTSMSSRTKNQDIVDYLNQSKKDDGMFREEVEKLYEDGNLTAYEIAKLERFKNSES